MKLFSFFAIFQVDSYEILNFESKPPVYGRWTEWENWSTCAVFPIDRSRKFSNRTRICECNNCNNYCVGKKLERKICSCAPGYGMGENKWLPCIKLLCLKLQPDVGGQVRYYDVDIMKGSRESFISGRYKTDGEVNGHVRMTKSDYDYVIFHTGEDWRLVRWFDGYTFSKSNEIDLLNCPGFKWSNDYTVQISLVP